MAPVLPGRGTKTIQQVRYKNKKKTVLGNGQSSSLVNVIFIQHSRLPDVCSSFSDSKYWSVSQSSSSPPEPDTTVSRRKGPILMSVPLYLIKAEIVGTSLMIWEKSSDKVTAYLKQDYSQLANPSLEKQSVLMKQFFKIQNLEARAEFLWS